MYFTDESKDAQVVISTRSPTTPTSRPGTLRNVPMDPYATTWPLESWPLATPIITSLMLKVWKVVVVSIPSRERSHVPPNGKRKIIDSKVPLGGDMLVSRRVYFLIFTLTWGNDSIWLIFLNMGWHHHLVWNSLEFVVSFALIGLIWLGWERKHVSFVWIDFSGGHCL